MGKAAGNAWEKFAGKAVGKSYPRPYFPRFLIHGKSHGKLDPTAFPMFPWILVVGNQRFFFFCSGFCQCFVKSIGLINLVGRSAHPFFPSETHPETISRIFLKSHITHLMPERNNRLGTCHHPIGPILL